MTVLRQIGTLDLPNLTPIDLTGKPLPMLEWLAIDELWVDPAYQRDITAPSLRLIAQLVEGWDWLKLAPLLVAITDNGFEVIDGQTRATAAKLHPQIETVPCYVVDGSTLPQRAGAFVSHARARIAVTPGQIHHAAVTAGDTDAAAVDTVCRAAGVRILPFSPPFGVPFRVGDTVALASIKTMLGRRGVDRTTEVLRALVAAGLAPIGAQHLRAGEALCCEPEYAAEFGPEQLTAALQSLGTGLTTEVKTLAAAKGLPAWRALVGVLFKVRKARPRTVTETDSTSSKTPEKPTPQPSPPSAVASKTPAIPLSSKARIVDRRPVGSVSFGDPPPGRSALDQRRASTRDLVEGGRRP